VEEVAEYTMCLEAASMLLLLSTAGLQEKWSLGCAAVATLCGVLCVG
jgi:hypothetical protein